MNALHTAIQQAGGQRRLADMMGLSPQVVHNWVKRGNVPAEHCPLIEKATSGKVRCEDLRPDVEWSILRGNCLRDEAAHDQRGPSDNEMQAEAA